VIEHKLHKGLKLFCVRTH